MKKPHCKSFTPGTIWERIGPKGIFKDDPFEFELTAYGSSTQLIEGLPYYCIELDDYELGETKIGDKKLKNGKLETIFKEYFDIDFGVYIDTCMDTLTTLYATYNRQERVYIELLKKGQQAVDILNAVYKDEVEKHLKSTNVYYLNGSKETPMIAAYSTRQVLKTVFDIDLPDSRRVTDNKGSSFNYCGFTFQELSKIVDRMTTLFGKV